MLAARSVLLLALASAVCVSAASSVQDDPPIDEFNGNPPGATAAISAPELGPVTASEIQITLNSCSTPLTGTFFRTQELRPVTVVLGRP